MSRYIRLDGTPTDLWDNQRGLWYSVSCGYWTDNWDKLKTITVSDSIGSGIPCCPTCRCPGMQTTWNEWFAGGKVFEELGNPWYCKFLLDNKETCGGRTWNYKKVYEEWRKQKGLQ